MNQDGVWLPIIEYANVKKTSISTIRRSIKAGHVKYKEENGKYLVWTKLNIEKDLISSSLEIELLKKEIKKLNEENNDLKMLLSIYENNTVNNFQINLPPLPECEL
jgi:cell division protein FtsB